MNAVAHAYKPIHTHGNAAVCMQTCTLNLFQQTLLEYQCRVLPQTLILAIRKLGVWAYSSALKVGATEYNKTQVYFFPWGTSLPNAIYYIPTPHHWYMYWQVILAKVKESSGRFPSVFNRRPGLSCPHIVPSLTDPCSSLAHSCLQTLQ